MVSRIMLYALAVTMALCSAACAQVAQEGAQPASAPAVQDEWEQGFTPLFNGVDLSGWRVMGSESWSATDGVLECSGEGGGWIRSDLQYRDFTLRLEYKVTPGANSGIFLRATEEGNPAFTGMEIQVLDDYGGGPDTHSQGALYDAVAPAVNPSKPAGEWNQVEISLWGDRLTVIQNGHRLYSISLAEPALNAAQSEERKFPHRAKIGYIGLQNHGSRVSYRNILINDGFVPIFSGRDLTGWQVMGSESWSAQDGVLTCSGQGGGWLRSNAEYRDFVLRLEYKVAPGANSGIFLRATEYGNPAFTGMEIQVLDDHGRAPDTHSQGSLYDAVEPAINPSKPAGEWNQVEITLWGDTLIVIQNGQKLYAVNLADPALNATQAEERKFPNRAQVGYIGLQNHGSQVSYRNIRVNRGFVPVLNGYDLDGWETVDPNDASWSVQNGVLVCDGRRGDYLYSGDRYGDFALRIQYRIAPKGNSGVFFRVGDVRDFPGSGAEVQVLDSYGSDPGAHSSGALYGVIAPSKNTARPADEWNQFEISCWQGQFLVMMNGKTVIDVAMDENDKLKSLPAAGHIGLQNHGSRVEFRDLLIRTPEWAPPALMAQR